jgi:hypothetical protein
MFKCWNSITKTITHIKEIVLKLLFDEGVDCNESNTNTPPTLEAILKSEWKHVH